MLYAQCTNIAVYSMRACWVEVMVVKVNALILFVNVFGYVIVCNLLSIMKIDFSLKSKIEFSE